MFPAAPCNACLMWLQNIATKTTSSDNEMPLEHRDSCGLYVPAPSLIAH